MELVNFPKRKPMPCPFGGVNDANITPIEMASSNNVNFYDGFPSVYGAPSASGGKFVTRKEMNAIGNLASNDLFYHKCGGLNTFDPEFAIKIGGYPEGAVLQMLFGNDLVNVVSLVDNNMVDFTGSATPEQIQQGILLGTIDGANWRLCNSDYSVRSRTLFEMPKTITGQSIWETSQRVTIRNLITFRSDVSGVVSMDGNWNTSEGRTSPTPMASIANCVIGFRESQTTTFTGEYKPFFNLGPENLFISAITGNMFEEVMSVFSVRQGYYYDIAFYAAWRNNGGQPLALYTDVDLKAVVKLG